MTDLLQLTMEEMLQLEMHYCEQTNLKLQKEVMVKDKDLLKNKVQIAQLIAKVAELEVKEKSKQILDFENTIKSHQENYELGQKKQIKDRLGMADDETFSYSPKTLEVTIRKAANGAELQHE